MDEIKQEVATDVASEEVVADETAAQASENTGKKKIKLPAWLQKLVDKIKSNEDVRQMVVFTLFSFICGGSQLIITLVLPALLKLAPETSVLNQKFYGFDLGALRDVFGYPTTSDFIGFLIGSIVGQVLTFVLNRKKTFNCTNNVIISGIMYVILAVTIIFVQTLLGSAIMTACMGAKPVAQTEFLYQIYNLTGQAVGGITALVMSFVGNKFLVMRNWAKRKTRNRKKTLATPTIALAALAKTANLKMQHKTPLPRSTKRQPTKNNLPTENNQTFQFESDALNRAPLLFYPKIAPMQKQAVFILHFFSI